MIAKLISHGRCRDEARRKLLSALEEAVALGVETNQAFLRSCLEHPVFAAGEATTAFVDVHGDELLQADPDAAARARVLAGLLLYATDEQGGYGQGVSSIAHRLPVSLRFDFDGERCDASITRRDGDMFAITLDEQKQAVAAQIIAVDDAIVTFVCDGLTEKAAIVRDRSLLLFRYRGKAYRVEDRTYAAATRAAAAGGDGKVRASMSGRVVAVPVEVGATVEAGQPVLVLEAMKMEHVHLAPIAGEVVALHVAAGEQVAAARIVAEIEPR